MVTNAEGQRTEGQRYLKDPDGGMERINGLISVPSRCAFLRLARHYRLTQREMMERLIDEAESRLVRSLPAEEADDYYR